MLVGPNERNKKRDRMVVWAKTGKERKKKREQKEEKKENMRKEFWAGLQWA